MITMIEGVDGTGKSTYAQRLAREQRATYRHAGPPTQVNWFEEYIAPLGQENMVLDRWALGELVWPDVFGRPSLFAYDQDVDACFAMLARHGAQLILLVRDDAGIVSTLKSRGEDDQIDRVLAAQHSFVEAYYKVQYVPKRIVHSDSVWSVA